MRAVVRLAYEAACAFVPLLVVAVVDKRRQRRSAFRPMRSKSEQAAGGRSRQGSSSRASRLHVLGVMTFVVYLLLVMWICGVGTLWDFLRGGAVGWRVQVNVVPFSPWLNPVTWLLNVVLFVPLGFLLPCLWRGYERLPLTFAAGFCFSLAIELSQLLNFRITDVDDLIANTLGAVLGLLLFRLARAIGLWAMRPRSGEASFPKLEPTYSGRPKQMRPTGDEALRRRTHIQAGHAARHLGGYLDSRGPAYEPWLYAATMFLGIFFLYGARGHAEMRIVSWLDAL